MKIRDSILKQTANGTHAPAETVCSEHAAATERKQFKLTYKEHTTK